MQETLASVGLKVREGKAGWNNLMDKNGNATNYYTGNFDPATTKEDVDRKRFRAIRTPRTDSGNAITFSFGPEFAKHLGICNECFGTVGYHRFDTAPPTCDCKQEAKDARAGHASRKRKMERPATSASDGINF